MTPRRRVGMLVLLTGLAMMLGFLYNRTQAVDIEAQNRVALELRELQQLDAEWNENILRSHIGLNVDYDPLTAPLERMRQLQARLGDALPAKGGPGPAQALAKVNRVMADKEELVEQFKSQNAILRNSLMYFPPAITELKTELDGIGGALVAPRIVVAMDGLLNALLSDILRFNLAPEPALGARIEQAVQEVTAQGANFSPAVQQNIDELARHARTIVRYRMEENALEVRINDTHTAQALDQLGAQFDKAFDEVLLEKQRFRSYLSVYSVLLLLLLVYAAWRLRRSYTIIGVVNRRLQGANELLEQRVAERTAALEAQSARLEQLAQHDSLTGLINYGQLTRLLDHAMVRAARRETSVVVMFIDLDGFKAVNDTYGHATGDLVLKEVAQRVSKVLRKEDALARLGGDEFVILLEEVSSLEGCRRVAQLALDTIHNITEAGGNPIRISASIGISSARGSAGVARGAAALLAEADQAMYEAKQRGKAGFAFSPHAQWGASPAVAGA